MKNFKFWESFRFLSVKYTVKITVSKISNYILLHCSLILISPFLRFQKVFASRKELLEYDLQQREAATKSSRTTVQPTFTASQYRALSVLGCGHTSSTKCYGCASAVTEHCITLLRALATNSAIRHILVSQGLIRELFDYNLRRGAATMREEVRQLMCLLTRWGLVQRS